MIKVAVELEPLVRNVSGIGVYARNLTMKMSSYQDSGIELSGSIFDFLLLEKYESITSELGVLPNISPYFDYRIYRRIWDYIPIKYNILFPHQSQIYHFFNYVCPPKIDGKVIITVHDMVYRKFPETMSNRNIRRFRDNFERSINRADKIITISESAKYDFLEYYPDASQKVEIISPGVDAEKYQRTYQAALIDKTLNRYSVDSKKYLLCIGNIEPRKNMLNMVKAFEDYMNRSNSNHDFNLVIVGSMGWKSNEFLDYVNQSKYRERIRLTGFVSEDDKIILLQNAMALLFASLYEGFGIPILEGYASKTPVITSNCYSMKELGEKAALLVDPNSIVEISNAIDKVSTADEAIKRNVNYGYNRVQEYSWKKSACKQIDIYKNLISEEY